MTANAMFPGPENIVADFKSDPNVVADARNVNKMQEKSLEKMMVSSWSQTTNWFSGVLSRLRTSSCFFLRILLDHNELNTKTTLTFPSILQTDQVSPFTVV